MDPSVVDRTEAVEAVGLLCQTLGLARSVGQIYGLLYWTRRPLCLGELVEVLGISKASASMGTRQLAQWGVIRPIRNTGDRRDFFEVASDLSGLMRCGRDHVLKPKLENSTRRLHALQSNLEAGLRNGAVGGDEFKFCAERLRSIGLAQKKLAQLAFVADELLDERGGG